MKKCRIALLLGMLMALCSCESVRMIVCDKTEKDGTHIRITSADRLFWGCGVRLCEYTKPGQESKYGIELDIEDRIIKASHGDLLTITLSDGSKVVLRNQYDSQSEVTETIENETQWVDYTDFVPVYDAWNDAVYSVPVRRSYTYQRPVRRQQSEIKLHYPLSKSDYDRIVTHEVSSVVIATDSGTIENNGSSLPEILSGLMNLFVSPN